MYAIAATPASESSTLSYSLKDAPATLDLVDIDGEKLEVEATTHVTGTLCIGVSYQGVTNVYEIGISIDPEE